MPIARFEMPDGRIARFEVPEGTTPEQAHALMSDYFSRQAQPKTSPPTAPKKMASPAQQPPAKQTMGGQVARQLGLTARYLIEGPSSALGVFSEPVRQGINWATGAHLPPLAETGKGFADRLGLPVPGSAQERVIGAAAKTLAGAGSLIMTGGALGALAGIPGRVAASLAASPAQQLAGAASGGAAGEYVKEQGGGPLAHFGASLAGGIGGAAAASGAGKASQSAMSGVKALTSGKLSDRQVNAYITELLRDTGVEVGALHGRVRAQLVGEVRKALKTGKPVDAEVVRRIADYGAVGATPTRGSVTLDPVQITQERNLAKVGANATTQDLQQLAQVQHKNNAALIGALNDLGAGQADMRQAGNSAVAAIAQRDAAARSVEKELYDATKGMAGREIPLDSEAFVYDAYRRLAEANKGAFLPEKISALLREIREGKTTLDGQEFAQPFTVNSIDALKTTLAKASRSSKDGNEAHAISLVRDALEDAPIKASGMQAGGGQMVEPAAMASAQGQADELSAAALDALDKARRYARARRKWQESAPGISAALDGAPGDNFVREYIISSTNKASARDAARMLHTIRKDKKALADVRGAVLAHLKEKALGGASDEVGNFSASQFNNELRKIGDAKLKLLFSAREIAALKSVGRVASYETAQPRGSAVNNSNTASALSLLENLAGSKIASRIPFGEEAIIQPLNNFVKQRAASQALNPYGAIVPPSSRQKMQPIPYGPLSLIPLMQGE